MLTHGSLDDNNAVSNVYVTEVLSRAHKALTAFTAKAETEDSLREVISDIRMQMVRSVHRISVEVSFFESLNTNLATVQATLAQLSLPAPSSSTSGSSN